MGVKERMPVDIQIVAAMVLLLDIFVFVLPQSTGFIRAASGMVILLFLPGYVLTSALFPGKDDLEGIERLALSLGLSIVIVPFTGFALNYSPWGITLGPIVAILSIYILFMCVITILRRHQLPEGEAFSISLISVFRAFGHEVTSRRSGLDRALTIFLLFSVILATATITYVLVTPREGEQYTEFYILGMNGTAAGYPAELEIGESGNVILGVKNHEGETVNYRLELRLDNRPLHLAEEYRDIHIEDEGEWENTVTFTPEEEGDNMKLQFLLYRNEDLTEPYRELHLWIDVGGDQDAV
ncbi:DUF1616 domain-containing protein [Methanolobus halotolerans]|uniref:DUF1616 domain-containing protein n=1 Tax=Methanolobus halotolerans TaxID=2052935 RepID=A0A4E0PUD8_9EURY|nr:DUF1616 domain-containing protein [Methanolobus halotolerans]TGC08708.1 hypothetical protein CUN85_08505 [Methanolobus halotolerans]